MAYKFELWHLLILFGIIFIITQVIPQQQAVASYGCNIPCSAHASQIAANNEKSICQSSAYNKICGVITLCSGTSNDWSLSCSGGSCGTRVEGQNCDVTNTCQCGLSCTDSNVVGGSVSSNTICSPCIDSDRGIKPNNGGYIVVNGGSRLYDSCTPGYTGKNQQFVNERYCDAGESALTTAACNPGEDCIASSSGAYCGGTACQSDWRCTEWSTCSGGTQTRTCHDENICNPATSAKPAESQACTGTCNGMTQSCQVGTCAGTQTCAGSTWGNCVKTDPNCGSGSTYDCLWGNTIRKCNSLGICLPIGTCVSPQVCEVGKSTCQGTNPTLSSIHVENASSTKVSSIKLTDLTGITPEDLFNHGCVKSSDCNDGTCKTLTWLIENKYLTETDKDTFFNKYGAAALKVSGYGVGALTGLAAGVYVCGAVCTILAPETFGASLALMGVCGTAMIAGVSGGTAVGGAVVEGAVEYINNLGQKNPDVVGVCIAGGSDILAWLTQSTIINGIPNWGILVAGFVILMLLMKR